MASHDWAMLSHRVVIQTLLEDVGSSNNSCCFAVGRWLDGHSYSALGYRGRLVCSFMLMFLRLSAFVLPVSPELNVSFKHVRDVRS